MLKVTDLLYKVKGACSVERKKALLKQYKSRLFFKEILQFVYNPYIQTGIDEKKLAEGKHTKKFDPESRYYKLLTWNHITRYYTEHNSGSAEDTEMAWYFINACDTEEDKELAKAIILKKLDVGVTAKVLNEVYGEDFIQLQ